VLIEVELLRVFDLLDFTAQNRPYALLHEFMSTTAADGQDYSAATTLEAKSFSRACFAEATAFATNSSFCASENSCLVGDELLQLARGISRKDVPN
jgi:hypothetical protein